MKSIIIILGTLICIALLLGAAIAHFRLVYVFPIVFVVGFVLAMLLTKSNQATLNKKYVAPLFVTISYLIFSWFSWQIFIIHQIPLTSSQRTHAMTWENKGKENHIGESEIVFQFVDYRGSYEGVFSNKIANYLESLPTPRVDVTFEISRYFGCWGGYRTIRIGEISHLEYRDGYASGGGSNKESPWDEFYGKWWCP